MTILSYVELLFCCCDMIDTDILSRRFYALYYCMELHFCAMQHDLHNIFYNSILNGFHLVDVNKFI